MTKLDLSGNHCFGQKDKTAVESLAAVVAASTTISELNLAGAGIDPDDAKILVPAIKAMGSLSKLKLDKYELPVQEIKTAKALDLSSKGLGVEDAIVVAALIKVRAIAKSCWTD